MMINYTPHFLLYLRLALGPLILYLGLSDCDGFYLFVVLFVVLFVATLSDIFDGMIARKLGVATEWLRRADSVIDTAFFVFVLILFYMRYPETWERFSIGIYAIFTLEIIRIIYDQIKFKKQAAYHMYSAKFWGLTLLFGFSEIFITGQGGVLFSLCIVAGIITDMEGLVASVYLKEWQHDVKSFYSIIKKEKKN
jgi:phosphatidylglycerophosphate synthase